MANHEERDAEAAVPHRGIALPFSKYRMLEDGSVEIVMEFDDRYTEGHYEGNPIVPGHWSLETMALAAGCAIGEEAQAEGKIPVLAAIERARFKKAIKPGEEVVVTGNITKKSSRVIKGAGTISVGGELAASLEGFTVLLASPEQIEN